MPRKLVVFTDLDSTLLDQESYSWLPATESINRLRKLKASLVMVSSKTFAEMVELHCELGFSDPFIVENGGGIALGSSDIVTERLRMETGSLPTEVVLGYSLIPLGGTYKELVRELNEAILEARVQVRGFSSMNAEEVSSITGLSLRKSILAKQRNFDEPFLIEGGREEIERLQKALGSRMLKIEQGGRFWHLFSHGGKGSAVSIALALFKNYYGDVLSVGLGDSPNDFSFLELMDVAILLGADQSPHFVHPCKQKARVVADHGPEAWNKSVLELLADTKEFS